MEESKLTLQQEFTQAISKYKEEEILFFNDIVQAVTPYIVEPEVIFSVITKEDGSNG